MLAMQRLMSSKRLCAAIRVPLSIRAPLAPCVCPSSYILSRCLMSSASTNAIIDRHGASPAARTEAAVMPKNDTFGALNARIVTALHGVSQALERAAVPYAVIGAVASSAHGYRRSTGGIDVLINAEDTARAAACLPGSWSPDPAHAHSFVDAATGAKLFFYPSGSPIAGSGAGSGSGSGSGASGFTYPAVAPAAGGIAPVNAGGVQVAPLVPLINMRLACAQGGSHRLKDAAEVQELIRCGWLPEDLADQLHESVRGDYLRIWAGVMLPLYPEAEPPSRPSTALAEADGGSSSPQPSPSHAHLSRTNGSTSESLPTAASPAAHPPRVAEARGTFGPFLPAKVVAAARSLARALERAGVPYLVAGAVAGNAHGHERATEDVDVIISPGDLQRAAAAIDGLGWKPRYRGTLRRWQDAVQGVDVDFIVAGEYPGDGLPKPVAFPVPSLKLDPADAVVIEGARVLSLRLLVQLKLASGMTGPGRLKDLADVTALVKANALPRDGFAALLDPSVRAQYGVQWEATQR